MKRRQAGMTLMEVMIAIAIMAFMMSLAWTTLTRNQNSRRSVEAELSRMHEIRVGLARVVADLEQAYLSKNEDLGATERRTMFVGKEGGDVDELRFSSLAHQVLWADANESEQTLISYAAEADREDGGKTNWMRREQRRLTDPGESWKSMSAETDVVLRDIEEVNFEFWDWKDQEWERDWDSTKDTHKDRLPTRVRITVTWEEAGDERKISTQARVLLQEPVEARHGTEYDR